MTAKTYIATFPANVAPPVEIVTLGSFEVYVSGKLQPWKGGSAGGQQLRNMLAYLISRSARPVQRDVLIEVAGSRGPSSPQHVITGLRNMLNRWGMISALKQSGTNFVLMRDHSWITDTDKLTNFLNKAEMLVTKGDFAAAVDTLIVAKSLCRGNYMNGYDTPP